MKFGGPYLKKKLMKEGKSYTYFLQENAPAHTKKHSMQVLQAVFNEQSFYLLYELISNSHKILPYGRDFYCMYSYSVSQKICFYIFIAYAPS